MDAVVISSDDDEIGGSTVGKPVTFYFRMYHFLYMFIDPLHCARVNFFEIQTYVVTAV